MSKPCLYDLSQASPDETAVALQNNTPVVARPPLNEISRVLRTMPVHIASDLSGGAIAQWSHDPFHEVVQPMTDHVVMTYVGTLQQLERRNGKSITTGTARDGVISIIPAGSTSRWDIFQPMNIIQLYLPHTTLERVAREAGLSAPDDLLERTAHPDLVTSRLLVSAVDAMDGNETLDGIDPF